jgi:hypothetical protein
LTCEVKEAILSLDELEAAELGELVQDKLTVEEARSLLDKEESDCNDSSAAADSVGTIRQAIADPWQGESIEETYLGGGNYPTSVFFDSSTTWWMCNSGSPEYPSDWVVRVFVYGSFANRSGLRVTGTNYCGNCVIPDALASRVYSDNDILSCVGYARSVLCCSGLIYTSDFRFGLI